MTKEGNLKVQSQTLSLDSEGYRKWVKHDESWLFRPLETALILSDVWDLHWSRGTSERTEKLTAAINNTTSMLRESGVLIVHAPSNTEEAYRGTPARNRLLETPPIQPPDEIKMTFPPLPIDDSDGGSDTNNDHGSVNEIVWSRQHEGIVIDHNKDVVSGDEGEKIYSLFSRRKINTVLMAGFSTNMCILNRSFGIKQMLRWGFRCVLFRDLTDSMYNPACSPYVSHEEGTRLIIEYIEKFVCPTTTSQEVSFKS